MSYPRKQHHAAPTMTRAQNRSAYKQWLCGCTDRALAQADPVSIGRTYGIAVADVASDIARQAGLRSMSQEPQRTGGPQS